MKQQRISSNPAEQPNRLPIIAFAPHPWKESQWMNRQHLLSRLALRGWPVIYSTGALDVWHRNSNKWREADWLGRIEKTDGVLLDYPGRWIPRWQRSNFLDHLALCYHARRLKRAAGISRGHDFITFLFHPVFWPYVVHLNPPYVIFHVYDTYSKMEHWTPALEIMQTRLIERADLLTAATEGMARGLPGPGPSKAKILYNAADPALFLKAYDAPCPSDLASIPHPRIANIGVINRKIDLGLIAAIAKQQPDWHWILVGHLEKGELERDPEARVTLAACQEMDNVHFLGEKSRLEIPAYLYHMDINTICYRIREGEWVVSGYPLKLHEYLTVGKPVIATPVEAIKNLFSHVVDIASTPEEWITAIKRALNSGGIGTVAERLATAMENTWDRRVDTLENWMFKMLESY